MDEVFEQKIFDGDTNSVSTEEQESIDAFIEDVLLVLKDKEALSSFDSDYADYLDSWCNAIEK